MKKKLNYVIPSIITFIVLGVIFYNDGLYPFGSKPLIQNDADYIYIPVMYKMWDLLHHGGSLFYTDLGLGNSIYGPLIIQGSLYSPLNLLLLFVKRDNICNFFGLFIIIKLCLVSLTSYIYINNKYRKIDYFYKILFSILYTFSGFFLLNYFNAIWLDIAILFPLLVLYLDKLLDNKNELGYIIILTISFIISFYFSFFVLTFILLYSAVNLYFGNRKKIKEKIFKLGKSTLIAFLISAFSSLPLLYQILTSSRFEYEVVIDLFDNIALKSLYWLFSPLFLVLFFKLCIKDKTLKKSKDIYKYIVLVGLYLIPLVFEPVNMLMHGGSYWCFPCRYGFIMLFILMDASLHYINGSPSIVEKEFNKKYLIYYAMIFSLILVGIFLKIKYVDDIIDNDAGILLHLYDMEIYRHIIYMIMPILICYIISLLFKDKHFKFFALGVISMYAIYFFSSLTMYYNEHYFLSTNAEEIKGNMKLPKDGRYKVEYTVYGPYSGLILDVPAFDNWLHLVPSGEMNLYEKMGYYLCDDKVYSYGGTIFTDWLLNLKYMLADKTKNDDMYTMMDKYKHKELYKMNYSNNYGLLVDDIDNIDEDNKFEYQNILYNKLFNNDKKLIDYQSYNYNNVDYIEFDYKLDGDGYLYFYSNLNEIVDYIIVNGEYTYSFDDSIRYLGYYSDNINVKIRLIGYNDLSFDIGFIKKEDINTLISNVEYKHNKYYVNSDEEKYLVMPINNIDGLMAYNNGVKVQTYKYLDNFVTIKVNKGKNVIDIKYEQPLLKIGIILSIIGLILFWFYKKIVPNTLILNVSKYLYIFIVSIMVIYMYIYAFFKFL